MAKQREMKNPTILMNNKDLEALIKQVESQVDNFKVGTPPTYGGFPIIAREYVEKGNIIIYDDVAKR
jgi:pyridoxine/pyridoxamine 5'-phosphate oxidase